MILMTGDQFIMPVPLFVGISVIIDVNRFVREALTIVLFFVENK